MVEEGKNARGEDGESKYEDLNLDELKNYAESMQRDIDKSRKTGENADTEIKILDDILTEIKKRTGEDYRTDSYYQ